MTTAAIEGANEDQRTFWNDAPGRKWAAHQARLDRLFSGVRDLLIARAAPRPGERVLDIGCGTGDTTLTFAAHVAQGGGRALGLDISEPLLALARSRAEGVPAATFQCADAQVAALEPGQDLVASRFGVMFFDDPVAAFRNLASALRPGGRMVLVAWAAQAENPWTTLSKAAGERLVGPPPVEPPGRPGQFAFADIGLVTGILSRAGLTEVTGKAVDLHLEVEGGPGAAADLATSIGPVARILQTHGKGEPERRAIAAALAAEMTAFAADGLVRVPARVNLFTARRS